MDTRAARHDQRFLTIGGAPWRGQRKAIAVHPFAAAGLADRTRFVEHQIAAQPHQRAQRLEPQENAQEVLVAVAAVGHHHLGLRTLLVERLHLRGGRRRGHWWCWPPAAQLSGATQDVLGVHEPHQQRVLVAGHGGRILSDAHPGAIGQGGAAGRGWGVTSTA